MINFENCKFSTSKPYKTVERLTVEGRGATTLPFAFDYGQIFPDVRHLRFKDYPFLFDGKFPHLTVIEANQLDGNFAQFFTNNPQIKTLNASSNLSSMHYLKAAHDLLPLLEEFSFDVRDDFRTYNGSHFVFPNVKRLCISDYSRSFDQSKFTFASLEQLTIKIFDPKWSGVPQLLDNEWIRFIENHKKQLRSIKMNEETYLDENGLQTLSKAANLVEANIFGGPHSDAEHIATFVRNIKLQRFKLNFYSTHSFFEYLDFIGRLRDQLDKKWKTKQMNFSPDTDIFN